SASGATSYDVRLGTSNPPPTVSSGQGSPSYAASGLATSTTYFWQIVARNAAGNTTGPVWSFATSAAPPPPLPSPWADTDIGAVALQGSASFANSTFTVRGSGDIWGPADAFHYVYQPISGDTTIIARIASEQNPSPFAKAGVMV